MFLGDAARNERPTMRRCFPNANTEVARLLHPADHAVHARRFYLSAHIEALPVINGCQSAARGFVEPAGLFEQYELPVYSVWNARKMLLNVASMTIARLTKKPIPYFTYQSVVVVQDYNSLPCHCSLYNCYRSENQAASWTSGHWYQCYQ